MKATNGAPAKKSLAVAFFCAAVYFCSYLTRKDFSVALVAITEATGFPDSAIAFVPTCLFFTYGIGQTVNGAIGDHVKPHWLMTGGLLLSAACNFVLPHCPGVPAMCVVWGINGFAQAMLWPPMSKIMIYTYSGTQYGTASMIISLGASLATVAGYLYIPAILSVASWQTVFYFGAVVVVICAVAWFIYSTHHNIAGSNTPEVAAATDTPSTAKSPKMPLPAVLTLGFILLDVVLVGMLRDGIETWTPTFLKEIFGGSAERSILITVILALLGCACVVLTTLVYRRFFRNELVFCGTVFLIATVFALVLLFANGKSMPLCAVTISMLSAVMHGANLALTAYVPKKMKRFGHVRTVSGVINSAGYLGAALSTYIIASIKETHGWNTTITVWAALAALGILLSAVAAIFWRRLTKPSGTQEES